MQENYEKLSSTIETMQTENKRLKKMLNSVLQKKNIGKTNSNCNDDVDGNLIHDEAQGSDNGVLDNEDDVEAESNDDDDDDDDLNGYLIGMNGTNEAA